MIASIFKKKDLLNFKVLFIFNIISLFFVNQFPSLFFFLVSSIFLSLIILNCKHYLFIIYGIVIFFSYQLTFYFQLLINVFDLKYFSIGNFYTFFNYEDIFEIYKPIHIIVSIFILALISFSSSLNFKENIIYLDKNIKKILSIFFFLVNLLLISIIIFDYINDNINIANRNGIFFKLMSLDIIGQLLRKLYFLNYLFLAFFAFEKKLFKPLILFSYSAVFVVAIINTSRLETIFLLIIFVIHINNYVEKKKYLLLFFLLPPFFWALLENLRRFFYGGVPFNFDNLFSNYISAINSIIGRVSYLFEVSIIYYSKLHGNILEFNYIWQSLIPSKFLKNKMSFYANDYQLMLDLNLIHNFYPYSNTAGLGIIGESYYFLGNNFWIIPLIISLVIYLILHNIQMLEKNFQNSFTLYFIFIFSFKDTFIGASLDYIFLLLFILIPIKIYTKIISKN